MTGFQWLRPRIIGLDADMLDKVRAYEAHSLPGEPYDVEPSPELRERVLALSHLVPQIPGCEDAPPEDDWYKADIACITCEDNPEGIRVGEWSIWMPCPDCPGPVEDEDSDYSWRAELYDDMERGK